MCLQALEIRKARLGEQHPDTAASLNNLAVLYEAQGRYDEAEPLYQQALAIMRERLGEQHPYTITVAGNYFACLMGMGKIEDALELLAQFPQLLGKLRGIAITNALRDGTQHPRNS